MKQGRGDWETRRLGERVLHLVLKRRWFEMIFRREKRAEYRKICAWMDVRLFGREYDVVRFRLGYAKSAPWMDLVFGGATIGFGRSDWGASDAAVYVIALGDLVRHGDCEKLSAGEVAR